MITLELGGIEKFDPATSSFTESEVSIVRFEYSLKALYEWEGYWKKAFLNQSIDLTNEEVLDFYYLMALDPFDKKLITEDVARQLGLYISDSQTATVFTTPPSSGKGKSGSGKTHTAEEIYALMFSNSIPLEMEERNLNRLLTMLKIMSSQSSPSKKMSRQDTLQQNAKLNAERKAKLNTKG